MSPTIQQEPLNMLECIAYFARRSLLISANMQRADRIDQNGLPILVAMGRYFDPEVRYTELRKVSDSFANILLALIPEQYRRRGSLTAKIEMGAYRLFGE